MSTTMEELVGGARIYLRDYPQFFEVDQGPLDTLTIRLPHPLIAPSSLQVYISDPYADPPVPAALTTAWSLDERNGLLKLLDASALGKRVLIAGYHYTWFADSDLDFHMRMVLAEISYSHPGGLPALSPVHAEVIMLGGVVHALWGLSIELSLDIDVSTPEGMFIPARQRYQQVLQMMQHLEALFNEKAAMLNMGLTGLEQFKLRRVAKLTGRYVPVYVNREIDDPTPPERLYPPIPDYTAGATTESGLDIMEALAAAKASSGSVDSVEEIGRMGQDIDWPSIGTQGGVMEARREAAQIQKHFGRYHDDIGEAIIYYRFDADTSAYDRVYDEGFRKYHTGVRIGILWVDQMEAVEDYGPEGRRPTQRIRLAVAARNMYEAGVSVTEVHGNALSDTSPSEVWRKDRMHDVFYYDNRFFEVSGFQIRGRLQGEDVIIGVTGIETFPGDDAVFDYLPGQVVPT